MNTYFFVKVRLRRTEGRRSFVFGPYVNAKHAESIIDFIPELLKQFGVEARAYNLYIEEKYPTEGKWIKIGTRVKIAINGDLLVSESG